MKSAKYLKSRDECNSAAHNLLEYQKTIYDLMYEWDEKESESCRYCHDPYWCDELEMLSAVQVVRANKPTLYRSEFEITSLLPYQENEQGEQVRYFICGGIISYVAHIICDILRMKYGNEYNAESLCYGTDTDMFKREDCIAFLEALKQVSDMLSQAQKTEDFEGFFSGVYFFDKGNPFAHFFEFFKGRFTPLLEDLIVILEQAIKYGRVPVLIGEKI